MPDWPTLAQTVALELLGQPQVRTRREWRWGRRGSFCLILDTGSWRDFEAGTSGGVLDMVSQIANVPRTSAWEWLLERGHVDPHGSATAILNPPPQSRQSPPQSTPGKALRNDPRRHRWALETWEITQEIPSNADHPARRWMAFRNLWRPEIPVPGPLRWLPADRHGNRTGHTGAGSIVALAAPPATWSDAWPQLPTPSAVQLIAVHQDGRPASIETASGELGKQTRGLPSGTAVILGNPKIGDAQGEVRVCEGVADALALSSRYKGPAVAVLGTGGMRSRELSEWLATTVPGVIIHADADTPGRAAGELRRMVQEAGGKCMAFLPSEGKDPAEAAAAKPFEELPRDWRSYAQTLQEINNWPPWEIARAATTTSL